MIQPYPIRFSPVLKQTIWGGRSLGEKLNKSIGRENNYAESWEIVDHGADQSRVSNGPLIGQTLGQLIAEHRIWLFGKHAEGEKSFPLLLKYLDCNRVLSVQVHPPDDYGAKMTVPDLGKTEAWYIVAANPGAVLYAGLKSDVNESALRQAIEDGRVEETLHRVEPSSGDCFFIPAGTVHALGAGLLVAEIQQSSDTTFRLFDWNRFDAEGNSRPLHIERSLEVIDFDRGPISPSRGNDGASGWQTLATCNKFELRTLQRGSGSVGGDDKFHILTVPSGSASLIAEDHTATLRRGDSVLIPAAHDKAEIQLAKDGIVLESHLP